MTREEKAEQVLRALECTFTADIEEASPRAETARVGMRLQTREIRVYRVSFELSRESAIVLMRAAGVKV